MNLTTLNAAIKATYPSIPPVTQVQFDSKWKEIILDHSLGLEFEVEECEPFLEMNTQDQVNVIFEKFKVFLIDLIDNKGDYFLGLEDEEVETFVNQTKKELLVLGYDYNANH